MPTLREMGLEPDPVIEAYKKDVDRTLLRENLKLTVEQRLENLRKMAEFYEQSQRARHERRHAG